MKWVLKPEGASNCEVAVISTPHERLLGGVWKEDDGYMIFAYTNNGPYSRQGITTRKAAVDLLKNCLDV